MYAIKLKERTSIGQQPYHIWETKPADWQLESSKKLTGKELQEAKKCLRIIAENQNKLNKMAKVILNGK